MAGEETGHHHLEKREGSTYMLSKTFTRRVFGIMAALLAITLACTMPCLALAADDSLGSVDEPAKSADGNAGEQKTVNGVTVSSEGDSALIEGCSFGINDFYRAQAGSNRAVGDRYWGYNYYIGTEPDNLSVISTGEYAVVYIPRATQEAFGFLYDNHNDQDYIKRYFTALDDANAKGSSRLSDVSKWYFTEEQSFEVDGVVFNFDQELDDGRYYAYVIGADGSDVTNRASGTQIRLDFADFARAVPPSDVQIVQAATGLAWLGNFLATMDYSPLWVTLRTTLVAIIFIFILGLGAAYFTMRISPRAQSVFDAIFTIPMVLPPTVCGFLLLLAFGRSTALGQWFIDIGFPLVFSWQATVLAAVIVAFPLMYRSSRGAFENLDPNMLDAARTLGWSNFRIFFKLMLPLAWSSIAAATVLAYARALGEFGATLFLAGNYAGVTRTIPIAIYFEWMNGNTGIAIFWTIVIIIFSFIVIMFINLWSSRTTRYRRRQTVKRKRDGQDDGHVTHLEGGLESAIATEDAGLPEEQRS